ncbi:hypothetical protein [Nannocystis sp.]|uniref:hypothetical protein n=1 Tax=Nannocystis sp. TaxID=1962667 RepID=UPI0025D79487|nr:hypothetical protein [Nannocystis sp.]MBK7830497.1 hypothetical protein [Nannocystis sp.]
MADETEEKLNYMADRIAARLQGQSTLPAITGQIQACSFSAPSNGCENLLYAPITTQKFYRSGRTDIAVIQMGHIPVAPGAQVTLAQESAALAHGLLQPALPPRQQRQQPRSGAPRVVSG